MAQAVIISKKIDGFPSLKEAFMVNKEGIKEMEIKLDNLLVEQAEMEEKLKLAVELNIPKRAFINRRARIKTAIGRAKETMEAYRSGYLEIPNLGNGEYLEYNDKDHYGFRLPNNVPLRVLQAIKEAKNKGLFEDIVVFSSYRVPDPIVVGKIGNRYFYVTSYR